MLISINWVLLICINIYLTTVNANYVIQVVVMPFKAAGSQALNYMILTGNLGISPVMNLNTFPNGTTNLNMLGDGMTVLIPGKFPNDYGFLSAVTMGNYGDNITMAALNIYDVSRNIWYNMSFSNSDGYIALDSSATYYYPVNGAWSDWSGWGKCSVTCGNGSMIRQRTCTNPPPANGGVQCNDSSTQYQSCQITQCSGQTPTGTNSNAANIVEILGDVSVIKQEIGDLNKQIDKINTQQTSQDRNIVSLQEKLTSIRMEVQNVLMELRKMSKALFFKQSNNGGESGSMTPVAPIYSPYNVEPSYVWYFENYFSERWIYKQFQFYTSDSFNSINNRDKMRLYLYPNIDGKFHNLPICVYIYPVSYNPDTWSHKGFVVTIAIINARISYLYRNMTQSINVNSGTMCFNFQYDMLSRAGVFSSDSVIIKCFVVKT